MVPSKNRTALPLMVTRAPRSSHHSSPPRGRYLICMQLLFTETLGPIRDQRAVGRAGDGVFGNALGRREKSRYEIGFAAWRRGDDGEAIDVHQCGHVRTQCAELVLAAVDHQVITRGQYGFGLAAQRRERVPDKPGKVRADAMGNRASTSRPHGLRSTCRFWSGRKPSARPE